jgi:CheY-like chemotaxis protein
MGNISVLIVDDSSVMRKIVERSLRPAGIEIAQGFEAGNGLEALAVLNEKKACCHRHARRDVHGWTCREEARSKS